MDVMMKLVVFSVSQLKNLEYDIKRLNQKVEGFNRDSILIVQEKVREGEKVMHKLP
jgi:hypothetical protein